MQTTNTEPKIPQPTTKKPASWSRPGRLLCIVVLGIAFFSLTTPKEIPSVMLIVGFMVLAGVLFGSLRLILMLTGLTGRITPAVETGIVSVATLLPLLLLILQSIGQLTLRDVLTLGGLLLVGIFYVSRVTLGRTAR